MLDYGLLVTDGEGQIVHELNRGTYKQLLDVNREGDIFLAKIDWSHLEVSGSARNVFHSLIHYFYRFTLHTNFN